MADREIQNLQKKKKKQPLDKTQSSKFCLLGVKQTPFQNLKKKQEVIFDHSSTLNDIVIPPNSNTFSDWRRTCHVSWVKTHLLPRVNKTH